MSPNDNFETAKSPLASNSIAGSLHHGDVEMSPSPPLPPQRAEAQHIPSVTTLLESVTEQIAVENSSYRHENGIYHGEKGKDEEVPHDDTSNNNEYDDPPKLPRNETTITSQRCCWSLISPWNHSNVVTTQRTLLLIFMIILVGCLALATILAFDIPAARHDQQSQFYRLGSDLLQKFEMALQEYTTAGLWIHEACRERDLTQLDFTVLYEYLLATGLEFQAVSFAENVTNAQRPAYQAQMRAFVHRMIPTMNYMGFRGFEPDPHNASHLIVTVRSVEPFYFPIRYIQPLDGE